MTKPIYNNYKPSKNYRKVVFTAGAKLQSAELNELQDIQLNYTSQLGEFLISTGTIISGGEVLTLTMNQIILAESMISVQGLPVYTPQASLELTGLEETIGVLVEDSLVTGAEDKEILQPDPDSPFYGEETSYRRKVVGKWAKSSEIATGKLYFPVMTIENGKIIATSANKGDNRDYINKSISTYDKGVHGNYVVEGLLAKNTSITREDNKFSIELSSGMCRVNGDEISLPTAKIFTLDAITNDTRVVSAEPIIFNRGQSEYTLRNLPIKRITQVVGTKEVTKTITRGSYAGGEDLLPHTPVLRIVEVKQSSKVYRAGADYIQSGDRISWSPSGEEPSPGSQYTIKFQYMSTFQADNSTLKLQLRSADLASLVPNTQLSVNYEFYLSRIDRIVASNGLFYVLKGVPDTPSTVIPQGIDKDKELSIATVKVSYGADPDIRQHDTVYMIPFADLKKMQDRLADVQYNILQLSLKDEAREMNSVTNKRGVIVDSLANEHLRDKGITQNARVLDGVLDSGSNFATQAILNDNFISLDTQLEYDLFNQSTQTDEQRINPYARPQTAPQAQAVAMPSVIFGNMWDAGFEGQYLPKAFKIKLKLTKFGNAEQIKISFRGKEVGTASADNQGNATFDLTLPEGLPYSTYEIYCTGAISTAQAVAVFELKRNDNSFNNYYTQLNLARQAEVNNNLQAQITQNAQNIEELERRLEREISERQAQARELETALNRLKEQHKLDQQKDQRERDRIEALIRGNDSEIEKLRREWQAGQRLDQQERDRLERLIRAVERNDANGRAALQRELNDYRAFSDRRFRDQEARIRADQARQDQLMNEIIQRQTELAKSRGLSIIRRDRADINHEWWTFQQDGRTFRAKVYVDPVAQSFIPNTTCDLSAVSVNLTELPTKMLYCKIVETTAGQPDITKLVGYGEIPQVSSLRLGWNKIPLESKVTVTKGKEYAVIILTESYEGKVAIAKVGSRDKNTKLYVKSQQDEGVLFLSANERTWTAVQDSDMAYKLHAVNYNVSKTIRVGTITPTQRQDNLTDFRLLGQVKNTESTSVRFYMMVNRRRVDLALNRTIFTEPVTKAHGNIEVFAELNSTSQHASPMINPGMLLLAGVAVTPATYVMRQFDIKNGQTNPCAIQLVVDQLVEPGCKITPSYQSGDRDTDFTNFTNIISNEPAPEGNNWRTVIYEVKGVQRASTRLKLTLETTHHENRPKIKNIRILVLDNY